MTIKKFLRSKLSREVILFLAVLLLGWFALKTNLLQSAVQQAHAEDARILEVQGWTEIVPLYGDFFPGCGSYGDGRVFEATSPAGVRVKVSVCHDRQTPGFWLAFP